MAPVEGCEKERKQEEVRHTGHKVITSVAGGITVVGVLLIFLQLRYICLVPFIHLVPFTSESGNSSNNNNNSASNSIA